MSRHPLLVLLSLLSLLVTAAAIHPIARDSIGNTILLRDLPGKTVYESITAISSTVDVNPYTLTVNVCADCHLSLGYQLGSAQLLSTSPAGVVLGGEYQGQYSESGQYLLGGQYMLRFHIPSTGRLALNFTYLVEDTMQDFIVEVSVDNPHGADQPASNSTEPARKQC